MNQCDERHEPKYRITYKSAKGGNYTPIWAVCESCIETKSHFGSEDEIESIEVLT